MDGNLVYLRHMSVNLTVTLHAMAASSRPWSLQMPAHHMQCSAVMSVTSVYASHVMGYASAEHAHRLERRGRPVHV